MAEITQLNFRSGSKQLDLCRIIQEFRDVYGRSPSLRELATEMDASRTPVHAMVGRLRRDGVIADTPVGSRYALALTHRVPYAPEVARELEGYHGGH